jgi:hypothetical protein
MLGFFNQNKTDMKIKGIDDMTMAAIQHEVANGGKFVIYPYCISVIILSFKRSSPVYFIKAGDNAFTKGLPFSLISFLLGWWGIPWGIIYTIGALVTNSGGGKNVTAEVMKALHQQTGGHVFTFEAAEAAAQ